ncbi:MAG TPA: AraC family transcriptional regulator, partial [Deinococcales bacterium]|nr:AraC family transcriptional regulator [Deinococcales bacterium]
MNHYERVQRIVDFLEDRLRETAPLDEAAAAANLSVPQAYRLFHALAGHTLGDYQRKRRLSEAALALTASRRTVLDVALEHGFESQEGFTRAFTALTGTPPGRWRRQPEPREPFPRLDLPRLYFTRAADRVS